MQMLRRMEDSYKAAAWALVYLSTLILVARGSADEDLSLFYTSPGNGKAPAGFYGAHISHVTNGSLQESVTSYGYQCAPFEGSTSEGLQLESASIDPHSSHVLLHVLEEEAGALTLYKGKVCHLSRCDNGSLVSLFEAAQLRHHAGPFAIYRSVIYFIYHQEIRTSSNNRKNIIELRKLVGCQDQYPVSSSSAFDIDDCSEILVKLHEGHYERHPEVVPTSGLLMTSSNQALVQLRRDVYNGQMRLERAEFVLYSVDASARKHELHRERVGKQYFTYLMTHLGEITKDGTRVCWTAVDRILCADHRHGEARLSNLKTMLRPGEAKIVCHGSGALANVTTGVVIFEDNDMETSLIFGCVADTEKLGGAGLLRMRNGRADAEITPLVTNSSIVYAGSVFTTRKCKRGNPGYIYVNGAPGEPATHHIILPSLLLVLVASGNSLLQHTRHQLLLWG